MLLSTSSTVWLTKAVDISVCHPVHVVAYTVPTCPAPSRCVSLFRYNLSSYYTLILLTQRQLYASCWDAVGLRRPPVLLVQGALCCIRRPYDLFRTIGQNENSVNSKVIRANVIYDAFLLPRRLAGRAGASASNRLARSSVRDFGSVSFGILAFLVPSVTYGP